MIGPLADRQNGNNGGNVQLETTNGNTQNEDQQEQKFVLPEVPAEYGSRTIPLSYLLDFAIQFTYHEFSILTELLQKKSESDRKISLAHFARSTRVTFLKLYALVKWVKKSKKFEQLNNICYFLDQQSEYYVEMADRFVQFARAELTFAGIPVYQVDHATRILSNGSYPYLPVAIKKRYIQERPLSRLQLLQTLRWLNSSIGYRLIQEAAYLSPAIRKIEIKNGVVVLTEPQRFVLKMTIFPADSKLTINFSDPANWRWVVLDVDILMVDYEIGDGLSLIHPAQKQLLIRLCQAQIKQSSNDIENVFKVLHEFSIKLQLDILFCQADQLRAAVSDSYVYVDKYDPRNGCLKVSYWTKKRRVNYSIKIERSQTGVYSRLRLHHHPYNARLPRLDDGASNFYQVFSQTIRFRCQERLQRVKDAFNSMSLQNSYVNLLQDRLHLVYQLLPSNDLIHDEHLQIFVDNFSGEIECFVGMFKGNEASLTELARTLGEHHLNIGSFRKCLQCIQVEVLRIRCKQSLDTSRIKQIDVKKFPLAEVSQRPGDDFLCFRLIFEPRVYLVADFVCNAALDVRMALTVFDFNGPTYKVTKIDNLADFTISKFAYLFVYNRCQIRHILSSIADQVLFDRLATKLRECCVDVERNVNNENVADKWPVKLKDFSSVLNPNFNYSFNNFVECYVNQVENPYTWTLECRLSARLPKSYMNLCVIRNRSQVLVEELSLNQHKIKSTADKLATQIVKRLQSHSQLHSVFDSFAIAYDYYLKHECTITHSTYGRLCVAYGETRNNLMTVVYKPSSRDFTLSFMQTAHANPSNLRLKTMLTKFWNPHHLLYSNLNEWFNREKNLISLVYYLINTCQSLLPLYHFTSTRLRSLKAYSQMMGIDEKNFAVELRPFMRVVSPTRLRLVYGIVHIEFFLLSNNRVIIDSHVFLNKQKHNYEGVPQFFEFWHLHSRGSVTVMQKSKVKNMPLHLKNDTGYFETASPLNSRFRNSGVSTPTPTASHEKVSPPPQRPISAPAAAQLGTPPKSETSLFSTLQSLLLDASVLQNAMLTTSADKSSPFNDYLHAINFLYSVGSALTHMAQDKKRQFPLRDIRYGLEYIEMSAVGVSHAEMNVKPWHVRIYLYLCNQTFTIRCNLTFSGVIVPDLQQVQIFERYFESRIVSQFNEMEVLSFVTACRVMSDGVFGSIAQIMELEMTSRANATKSDVSTPYWQMTMLLSVLSPPSSSEKLVLQAPSRRFLAGMMINENCKHLLITLSMRTNASKKSQKELAKRVELIYTLPTNFVTIRAIYSGQRSSESDKKAVEALISEVNKIELTECRIWPAVQFLLAKFRL